MNLRASRQRLLSVHCEEEIVLMTRGVLDNPAQSRRVRVSRIDLEVIWAGAQLRVCRTRFAQFEMLTQFERQVGVRGVAGASVLHGGTDCVPGNEGALLGTTVAERASKIQQGLDRCPRSRDFGKI